MSGETLRGLRVLELTEGWAGALCTSLLRDLGADVIKVEPPAGDWLRTTGPAMSDGTAYAFHFVNAGKHSLVVDPNTIADITRLRSVAAVADVIIEGDPAPAWLSANERLNAGQIRCAITPFGRTGPLAGMAGADLTLQALTGIMATTGYPEDPATRVGPAIGDHGSALFGVINILAALIARDAGATGRFADVAAFDTLSAYLTAFLPQCLISGTALGRQGNRHTSTAPWNAYATRDGAVLMCTSTDQHWQAVLAMVERPDLSNDPRYAGVANRRANADALDETIEAWTRTRATADVIAAAESYRLPIAEVAELTRALVETFRAHSIFGVPCNTAAVAPKLGADGNDAAAGWLAAGARAPVATVAPASALPLAGVRVLELAQYTSGPFCCRMLALLGAEVIKLEPPAGEDMRRWPPTIEDEGYFFHLNNSNKKSVTLDFKSERGRELLWQLIDVADVIVENFAAGTLDRHGFGAAAVRARNPRLTYTSIKGFGTGTALARKPAFDTIVQALGGMMATTGWPEEPPVKAGISASDLLGATVACARTLAALLHRRATDTGEVVDVSMVDVTGWTTQTFWPELLVHGPSELTRRQGNRHPLLAPHGTFPAADGTVAIAIENDAQWRALASLTGVPRFANDARYRTSAARRMHAEDLEAVVAAWTKTRPLSVILEACSTAGVPAAEVAEVAQTIAHPQALARGSLETVPFRSGDIRLTRLPLRLGDIEAPALVPIGRLGCDNATVYGELLGLSPDELGNLAQTGAI